MGLCDQTNGKKSGSPIRYTNTVQQMPTQMRQEASPLQHPHYTQSFARQFATTEVVVVGETTKLVATWLKAILKLLIFSL